jgi:hypothetical protein
VSTCFNPQETVMGRSPRPVQGRNPALGLVLRNAGLGALLGFAFAVLLVAADAHGLRALMSASDSGPLAFVLLAGGFMVTFGSLVAGGAVMTLGTAEREPPHRGLGAALVPVPVRARRRAPVQRDRY